jgi:hypothetical protein
MEKVTVCPENIEVKLFVNDAGHPCVRIRDLDAGENVSLVACADAAQAARLYDKAVADFNR